MHIADLDKGMLGANGIIGATGPLAVGAGLSARAKGENGVAVAFYGDGGSNQGLIFEAYNMANIWKLPVIFICEDNGYAEATPSSYSVAGSAGGPSLIHVKTARQPQDGLDLGMSTRQFRAVLLVGDAQTYRANGEIEKLRAENDCLKVFREKVVETGLLTDKQLDDIFEEARERVQDAASASQVAPRATEADLMTDVYGSY